MISKTGGVVCMDGSCETGIIDGVIKSDISGALRQNGGRQVRGLLP